MRRQPTETDLVMLAALPSSAGHWHPGLQGQELVQVVRGMSCNMGRYADRGLQIWRQGLQQPESGWTPPANAPMTTTRSHLALSLMSSILDVPVCLRVHDPFAPTRPKATKKG